MADDERQGRPRARSLAALIAERDRSALAAYRERREPAVQAYCAWVSLDAVSTDAAEASFATFAKLAAEQGVSEDAELDPLLLRATRMEAAARAPTPLGSGPSLLPERLRSMFGGSDRRAACEVMPKLLAARSSGTLSPADLERIGKHLSRCSDCRAVEARFRRAEEVFATRIEGMPTPSLTSLESPSRPAPVEPPMAAPPVTPSTTPPPEPAPRQPAPRQPAEPKDQSVAAPAAAEPSPDERTEVTRPPKGEGGRRRTLVIAGVLLAAIAAGGAALALTSGGDEATPGSSGPTAGGETVAEPATDEPVFDTSTVSVSLLVAAGDQRAAASAADKLEQQGFQIEEVGESPEPVDVTTVLFEKGDPVSRRSALAVKRKLLPVRSVVLEPIDRDSRKRGGGADVVVLVGPDLAP
jgi:hypothetical protein